MSGVQQTAQCPAGLAMRAGAAAAAEGAAPANSAASPIRAAIRRTTTPKKISRVHPESSVAKLNRTTVRSPRTLHVMDGESEDVRRQVRHLRAMSADPVRLDLFEALRSASKPLTSAELTKRVPSARRGIRAHLEQLLAGEWIEEVSGEGRETLWAPAGTRVAYASYPGQHPDLALATDELYWISLMRRVNRIRAFDSERATGAWPQDWVDASVGRDWSVWMTVEQLESLESDLVEVFEHHRASASSEEDADAELVFVTLSAFPIESKGESRG